MDGLKWDYVRTPGRLPQSVRENVGVPGLLPLDGRQVLLTSPQDMYPIGLEFHAGNNALCLLGDYDGEDFTARRSRRWITAWISMPPRPLLLPMEGGS